METWAIIEKHFERNGIPCFFLEKITLIKACCLCFLYSSESNAVLADCLPVSLFSAAAPAYKHNFIQNQHVAKF